MENKNPLLFAHALIVLPDERILLRKLCCPSRCFGKWTATIEKPLSKDDTPSVVITKAISNDLNINLSNKYEITMDSFNSINIHKYNRIIFPFIVNIKQTITLKSDIDHKFMAIPFSLLSTNVLTNKLYNQELSKVEYTLNTVHVVKETHLLKDALIYAKTRR